MEDVCHGGLIGLDALVGDGRRAGGGFQVLLAPAGVFEADREDIWVVLGVEHRLLRGTACALAADLVGRLVGADARHKKRLSVVQTQIRYKVRGTICSDTTARHDVVTIHSFSRLYAGVLHSQGTVGMNVCPSRRALFFDFRVSSFSQSVPNEASRAHPSVEHRQIYDFGVRATC